MAVVAASCGREGRAGGAPCVSLSKRFLYGLFLSRSLCSRKALHFRTPRRTRVHLNITGAAGCRIQLKAAVTLRSLARCASVFTSLLLSFLVHSYEDY